MKNLKLIALTFALSLSAQAGVSIISDLDDTIKITNAGNAAEATVNGVFTTSIYTGMDDFLIESGLEGDQDELHVVTASPSILRPRVLELLKKYKLKADSVSLRNVIKEKTPQFKKRVIRNILANSTDNFILIGDDVNEDHLIYDDLQKEYPERISGIYIHVIKGRELPASATRYWTAFDLTLREYLAGRLPFTAVERVAKSVLAQEKPQRIIPDFANCPTNVSNWDWQLDTYAADLSKQITAKVVAHCQTKGPK